MVDNAPVDLKGVGVLPTPIIGTRQGELEMAYNAPTFNLSCNVWHWASYGGAVPPAGLPDFNTVAQLRVLKTAIITSITVSTAAGRVMACFPSMTDVRGQTAFGGTAAQPDLIELPAGSGRYYRVSLVEDVAKGFSNEYRAAFIFQIAAPTPLP